jgi:hypothetical protein
VGSSKVPEGTAMAHAVNRRPLTVDTRVGSRVSPCGICGGESGTGTGFFSKFFVFPLSASFHHGYLYSYIIWGMNNSLVGGRSSGTSCHPMDMNNNTLTEKYNFQHIFKGKNFIKSL